MTCIPNNKPKILILSGLLGFVLGAPTAFASDSLQATGLRLYTLFQPAGGLVTGIAVTGQVNGSCFASSAATPARPDAYRCSVGNTILDPCFASLNEQAPLACVHDLWSARATLLTPTKALPSNAKLTVVNPDYAKAVPWALELANGQRCTLMTGATAPVAGLRINYVCPDGGLVAGGIDRSLPLWRVFFQTTSRSLSLSQVDVSVAWY